jgi:ankyrin repeat protein
MIDHLVLAVDGQQNELVTLFLEHGAQVDDGAALRAAVRRANLNLVRLLLEHGAPANHRDSVGRTPLFDAVGLSGSIPFRQRAEVIDELIKRGADLTTRTKEDRSILDIPLYAMRPGPDLEMLDLLISRGYPLNTRSGHGHTPLYYAARAKLFTAVQLFLKHGADPNDGGTDCDGRTQCQGHRTALHEASDLQNYGSKNASVSADIVSLLVRHGAKVNVRDDAGNTPLFVAVYSDNYLGAQQLLLAGSNVELGPPRMRPMDIARKRTNPAFVSLLVQFGAKE